MPRTFAAVIFDLDGTLIDSERLIVDAGIEALNAMGFRIPRDVLLHAVGKIDSDVSARIAAEAGPRFDARAFDAAWDVAVRRAYARGMPLRPGVRELLGHLDRAGLPRAVATNSHTASARNKLSQAGIAAHFDPAHVFGFDTVARPKPAPDLFLAAARGIGAEPPLCLAFEDSDTGVTAALAAGMTVVHVPDLAPRGTARAHHVAETILDGARDAGLLF
jgi:HAD superfamily hydrolase (TIGR01509 family)